MPDHDALRLVLSHLNSTAGLMLAEVKRGDLAQLTALVRAMRESTGAALRLLEGQEAMREVRSQGTPLPAPLPTREPTVELRARDK